MVLGTIAVLSLVLDAGIAFVIFKKYRQSHNIGFLVLGFGLLVWPLARNLIEILQEAMFRGLVNNGAVTYGWLVAASFYGQQIVQAASILIGLLLIGQSINGGRPAER